MHQFALTNLPVPETTVEVDESGCSAGNGVDLAVDMGTEMNELKLAPAERCDNGAPL
jgi:hypothetical protein